MTAPAEDADRDRSRPFGAAGAASGLPPPPPFDRVRRPLRATRARLRRQRAAWALGWLLCGLLLVSLGAAWVAGGDFAPWMRAVAVALGAALVIAALARGVFEPLATLREDEEVAHRLEDRVSGLHDGLLSSVHFEREWPRAGGGSPAMISAAVARAAQTTETLDLAALFPWRPALRGFLAAGAAGLLFAGALALDGARLARGANRLWPEATVGGIRETGPLVGNLSLTLHAPPHAGRPPRTLVNTDGDLEALKGTRVELTATTLEPATEAVILMGEGDSVATLPLSLSEGRDVAGTFLIEGETTWRFAVTAADGDRLIETAPRRIRVEPDHPPTVTLSLPAEDLELDDLRRIEVAFEARDDFGLQDVSVVVALAADPEHPERIAQGGVTGARFAAADEVDLSVVQAQPGDRLLLYVEAHDNNGVDGPQRGVSATRTITVHSPQAKHQALTERLSALIERLLDVLADRLEFEWTTPQEDARSVRLMTVRRVSTEAANELSAVVAEMADDPLTPEEVRLGLAGRLGAFERALDEEREVTDGRDAELDGGHAATLRAARQADDRAVDELEQLIVFIEAMVARLALEDMAALTEELQVAREQIAELMRQYKDRPDAALKARIMRDISRLRDRMRDIQARMAALRQKLPEEFLNLDGLKKDDVAKGLEKTGEQLDELEKMLDEGRIDEALAALDEMAQALDELSNSLNKDMQDLHGETNPELQKALSELMDQSRELLQRQEALREDTSALAEAERAAQEKLIREELAAQLKALKDKGERLQQTVEQMNPDDMPSIAVDEHEHLRQRVNELRGALDRDQFMDALEMAERSLDHFDAMDRYTRHDPRAQENRRLTERGRRLDQQIANELSQLMAQAQARAQQAQQRAEAGDPGEQGQPGQPGQAGATGDEPGETQPGGAQPGRGRPNASGLSQQQAQLSRDAQALKERIEGRGEQLPGLREGPAQRAEQAAQAMEDAAQRLRDRRPGHARPGQDQAISELQGLLDGLKQANQPKPADRQANRGRAPSKERVRIPGAEEHQTPEAFRRELLDAMKDRAPEAYQEQVKRYYESLVR